jgi:hypothetical protein
MVIPQTKDKDGRDRKHPQLWIAVALPKSSPETQQLLNGIHGHVQNAFRDRPHVLAIANQGFGVPGFSWKIDDGDNARNVGREGAAGCWIFNFSTSLPQIRAADQNNLQIDGSTIKLGYWVDVAGSVADNEQVSQPGIYMNPQAVRLLGYGSIITPGPSISQMFEGRAAVLPAGASATPIASTPAPAGWPAQQQPAAAPAGWPAQQQPAAAPAGWPAQQQPAAAPAGWPAQQQPGAAAGWPAQQQPAAAPAGWPAQQQPQAATPSPIAGDAAPLETAPPAQSPGQTAYPFNPNPNFGR